MSDAFLKSYFAFFQRGTGVILAHDPWRFFIELSYRKTYSSQTLEMLRILHHDEFHPCEDSGTSLNRPIGKTLQKWQNDDIVI